MLKSNILLKAFGFLGRKCVPKDPFIPRLLVRTCANSGKQFYSGEDSLDKPDGTISKVDTYKNYMQKTAEDLMNNLTTEQQEKKQQIEDWIEVLRRNNYEVYISLSWVFKIIFTFF